VNKAYAVAVPQDTILSRFYHSADLLDAFAIHLPSALSEDIETLARATF
jgi:hypothetical protein